MLRNDVNTINDWMRELATAMSNSDAESIEELQNISNDWLQTEDEREAQLELCESALELIDELDSYQY